MIYGSNSTRLGYGLTMRNGAMHEKNSIINRILKANPYPSVLEIMIMTNTIIGSPHFMTVKRVNNAPFVSSTFTK